MSNDVASLYLPAEWHTQWGVQLTWPHRETDWAPMLQEVTDCYVAMAREIARREKLLVVTPEVEEVKGLLRHALSPEEMSEVSFFPIETNDTWARDHGFITLVGDGRAHLLDFCFNGWGQKFEASKDNEINRRLYAQKAFEGVYEDHLDFVLEGGSIESDGKGTILTTSRCLLAPHRNQPLTRLEIERRLLQALHAQRILWLDFGYLEGDDTDSHIDTLARFCSPTSIAYVKCTDSQDVHLGELQKMEAQLASFRTLDGDPYELIPLPMARETYDQEGRRLPATYANFLILNEAVLMPTYGQHDLDEAAKRQLQKAFPDREIVGIDCQPLILQHGSLHCCTMQFPQPTIVQPLK